MNKVSRNLTIFVFLLLSAQIFSGEKPRGLNYDEQVHDFGHVGIDFKLFHTFEYVNRTDKVVNITDIDVSCDCSEVNIISKEIKPGDTAYFNLIFSTKDYFGPTTKSFTVHTTDPLLPTIEYFYKSIIGQWYDGLKPNPRSIFFLPGKDEIKITLTNSYFETIKLDHYEQYDDIFSTKIIKNEADKNKSLEIVVYAAENLGKGTLNSVLTLTINTGQEKPAVLSIPIKIVRY